MRIISLRTITHYIPRYIVYIVYYPRYAGGKSEDSLFPHLALALYIVALSLSLALYATDETLGPLPCTSARRISRARARTRVRNAVRAHRNTWRGLSNCIVNNLRKLRI